MEYLVTVTKEDEETGKESPLIYQQRMDKDFNLSRLILALNVQRRKRVKKEKT